MLPLLMQLAERWDEYHHVNRTEAYKPPTEQDLTSYKPYQLLIKAYPVLERQLILAWNGDVRSREKKPGEEDYIFPKLLRMDVLQKYEPKFQANRESMRCIKELFDLFCAKFKVVNQRRTGWFAV